MIGDPRLSHSNHHPLGELRVARGLSRERLAQLAGISSRTVYGIEREGSEPRRATAVVLAAVLGCEPSDLLRNDEGPGSSGALAMTTDAGGGRDGS